MSASTSYSRDRSLPKRCPRVELIELVAAELFGDGD